MVAKPKFPPYHESMAEVAAQLAVTARRQAETEQILKAITEKIDGISGEVSGIGGGIGEIFEIEAAEAIKAARKIGGIRLDAITEDLRSWAGNQYDLVGINGKYVVLIEVKQTLRADDIIRLAEESIPALKADFPANIKGKAVKGALVYRRIGGKPAARQKTAREALSRGIILMRAVGKNKLHHITNTDEVSVPARQLQNPAK